MGLRMIGPFTPRFDLSVGTYLGNSPTQNQRACFKSFFQDLADGPVSVAYRKLGSIYLVGTCGHVITIEASGRLVTSIRPGLLA